MAEVMAESQVDGGGRERHIMDNNLGILGDVIGGLSCDRMI